MSDQDLKWLDRAIEIAKRGEGFVEPNPMVGCVIVKDNRLIGEGWHDRFGEAHAEVNALGNCVESASGATAYVSLEPCNHSGKTAPCTEALIQAGVNRVVIGTLDPTDKVNGQGVCRLQEHGISVDIINSPLAKELIAPFTKFSTTGRPWVIAKWAMSLDGKLATRSGESQWISNEKSRQVVHQIRGKVDGIMVGGQTARADDPMLTARPPGARIPKRIVFTADPGFAIDQQLAQTASETPTLFTTSSSVEQKVIDGLMEKGCDVMRLPSDDVKQNLEFTLDELGKLQVTNLLVEGGAKVLGWLFDLNLVDEVHAFIAPCIIGGSAAPSVVAGEGIALMKQATGLRGVIVQQLQGDTYISGRVNRAENT